MSSVKSKINMSEEVSNKDRKFGSALSYYPVRIQRKDDDETVALFTENEIAIAIARASQNPEDIPESTSIWHAIFG